MNRPRRVYLLRHGQSTFQATYDLRKVDPGIKDARLTEWGKAQVKSVLPDVRRLRCELVVTSPLTRALETALGLFEKASPPPILIEALLRERLGDACDIGRPASELAREFPMLDFRHLPETWWYTGEEDERGVPIEPRDQLEQRVAAFSEWLSSRSEEAVLVVGHSEFLRQLAGFSLANCELREWTG